MEEENIKKIKYTTNIFREKNIGIELFRYVVKHGRSTIEFGREIEIIKNLERCNLYIAQVYHRGNPNNLEHIAIREYEDGEIEIKINEETCLYQVERTYK